MARSGSSTSAYASRGQGGALDYTATFAEREGLDTMVLSE